MAVTSGQCKGLEPMGLPKISILGANVLKAFEAFLGLEIHNNVVILERALTNYERAALIRVVPLNYPDPLLPSAL
jgi:hypothetical protein